MPSAIALTEFLPGLLLLAALLLARWARAVRARRLGRERLASSSSPERSPDGPRWWTGVTARAISQWVGPAIVGVAFVVLLKSRAGLAVELAVALGVVVAIVARILFGIVEQRRALRVEQQLADAVDILAASLRAGLAVGAAIDAAAAESGRPLGPLLETLSARLRLGEDPEAVFEDFRRSVGGPTARLLAFTLAVHWEAGGSIAGALRNVAKVARDRIELSRRVKAQAAESQLSVVGVLAITYAVGALMWFSNPEGTAAFFGSRVGVRIVALIVALQAIGLIWMRRQTRIGT